jgi:PAS domain S-box-containing protein
MNSRVLPEPDYRTLFHTAPGCHLVLLPDFTIVAVSDGYLNATMTRREDIIGRGLFEVFPDNPGDVEATGESNLRASLANVLRTKLADTMAVQKYDIRQPASAGGAFEERYWSPINTPVLDADQQVSFIIHRVEDVTEFVRLKNQRAQQHEATEALRARAEDMGAEILARGQELQKINKQLLDNQIFLDSVVENIPNMVFVKDAKELRFVLLNKAGEELLGYARTDLVGKSDYDLFPKDQADFFVAKDQAVLRHGELTDIPEEPIRTHHRGTRVLHTRKIPIRDSRGQPMYLLGISDDITEAKAAQEKIRELNETLARNVTELEAVNHELELFSYSVSHDLRAPLRTLQGFSQILLNEFDDLSLEERNQYLQRVDGAAGKMALLVDGLLNLSRLTRTAIRREPVDVSAIARSVIQDLKAVEPHRSVNVLIEDKLIVEGDRALLHVVMQNLLHNAWKFSSKKAHTRIEVGSNTDPSNGSSVYFVRDNGAGFNMEYKNKLFGAFERLHSDGEFQGDGIGLATVQRVIQRHGGKIWADSGVDKGATFYFTVA